MYNRWKQILIQMLLHMSSHGALHKLNILLNQSHQNHATTHQGLEDYQITIDLDSLRTSLKEMEAYVDWWSEQLFRYYNYYTILGVTIFRLGH